MQQLTFNIIGAGIGGLTTALALQRFSFAVQVYEQADELREVGAGLTLCPNANHALNFLGLRETLSAIGDRPNSAGIKHYKTGEMLVENARDITPLEKYGADYLQLHRADLHQALLAAVRANDPNCIHLCHDLIQVNELSANPTATFSSGKTVSSNVLVGCDGIRSAVRQQLFGDESPRFTGYIAWRGLVPTERLRPGLIDPDSAICTGPERTFTRYTVRHGSLLNYVAVAKRSGWELESWSIPGNVRELVAEFSDFEPAVQEMLAATPPEHCFQWALFDRDPLPQWSQGAVTLLGDAAHPMLPFMGQGAAMAIEDAVVFARAFAASDSTSEGLQRYEKARKERTTFVMLESRANIKRLQTPDTNSYSEKTHKNEEVLGLFDYNPATTPV